MIIKSYYYSNYTLTQFSKDETPLLLPFFSNTNEKKRSFPALGNIKLEFIIFI